MNGAADAIKKAVNREIDERRALLDASNDVGEVTITVKLQPGTAWVRGVRYQEERVFQQRRTT